MTLDLLPSTVPWFSLKKKMSIDMSSLKLFKSLAIAMLKASNLHCICSSPGDGTQ